MKAINFLMAGCLLGGSGGFASSVTKLTMDEDKRLIIRVGKNTMNRIGCRGDKLRKAFNEEGVFGTVVDEANGQLFINPAVDERIPASFVTESGITQDVILVPTGTEPITTILISAKTQKEKSDNESEFRKSPVELMQKLITKNPPLIAEAQAVIRSIMGFDIVYVETRDLNNDSIGVLYKVKNKTSTDIEMRENHFVINGDRAISFKNSVLKPEQETMMYVVRQK